MKHIIKQLDEKEVIPAIVDDMNVIRVNLDNLNACELKCKSINTIRNDLEKDCYIYFVVEEGEHENN